MSDDKEYWFCIIGPIDRKMLPIGADSPPRRAAQDAVALMTGDREFSCWSGWGVTEERKEKLLKI